MHIDLQIALIYTFYLLLAIAFDRFETYLIRYEVWKRIVRKIIAGGFGSEN